MNPEIVPFNSLIGKKIINIDKGVDFITFIIDNGDSYKMMHRQDCCESVTIDDIIGNIDDLLNSPITFAQESFSHDNPKYHNDDDVTWTFYKLATINGWVDIRWYGTSNGYYSTEVDLFYSKNIQKKKENKVTARVINKKEFIGELYENRDGIFLLDTKQNPDSLRYLLNDFFEKKVKIIIEEILNE